MNILIDTAVKGCLVALFDETGMLTVSHDPIERGHAEHILPTYQSLMSDINKTEQDIENIYVTVGPGSFTGLRVGLSVARFMAMSLNKPVYGIVTFDAFLSSVPKSHDGDVCVVLETKRRDYYVCCYSPDGRIISPPQSVDATIVKDIIGQLSNPLLIGDAVNRLADDCDLTSYYLFPLDMVNASDMGDAINNGSINLTEAQAFYIRDADVSQPKKVMGISSSHQS